MCRWAQRITLLNPYVYYIGVPKPVSCSILSEFFFFYPFHEKVYLWPHDGTILPQCILSKTSRNSQILEVWEARERIISYCRQRIRIQEPVKKKMNKVYTVILVGLVVCCSEYEYNSDWNGDKLVRWIHPRLQSEGKTHISTYLQELHVHAEATKIELK